MRRSAAYEKIDDILKAHEDVKKVHIYYKFIF